MAADIRLQLVSGRARRLATPLQLPPKAKVALVLVGAAPGFLERALGSGLFRRQAVRVAVAPRVLRLPGKSGSHPNPGWAEAVQARKDGLVQRVALPGAELHGAGFVCDLTPYALAAREAFGKLPPASRHARVLAALAAGVPPTDGYDQVVTVLEMGADGPIGAHLQTAQGPRDAAEHLLREMVLSGPRLAEVVRDASLLLLMSPDGRLVARLDPADRRTAGRARVLAAVNALGKLYAGSELTPEEGEIASPVPGDESEGAGAPASPASASPAPPVLAPAASGAAPVLAPAASSAAPPGRIVPPAGAPLLRVPPREGPGPSANDAASLRRAERAQALAKAQAEVSFPTRSGGSVSVRDILAGPPSSPLRPAVAPGEFIDPAVARPRFDALVSGYMDGGHYDRDLASVLTSLSGDRDLPIFVEAVQREDTSDALTQKETVTVTFRDSGGRAARAKFDLPLFSRDGYVTLSGVKYSVTKQILALPVIKVSPDEVLITTAYNKARVERFGQVSSPRSAYVRQLAQWISRARPANARADLGSATGPNSGFVSGVDYNDIARTVRSITAGGSGFYFSRQALDERLAEVAPWSLGQLAELEDEGGHGFGWGEGGAVVYAVTAQGTVRELRDGLPPAPAHKGIDEVVYDAVAAATLSEAPAGLPAPGAAPRKYAYSRVKMLSQWLPAAVICGFSDGLEQMLRRAGVPFKAHPIPPGATSIRMAVPPGWDSVRFADCFLTYPTARLRDTLLVNGLNEMETSARPLADFGPGAVGWVDFIADRLGSPGHARALTNFEASFIDPVSREVLADMGLPTDMSGVIIYASSLLETNQHREANDMANYRLRGPELVPVLLYKALHREMERVRATRQSAVPQKLSLAQGQIIKDVLAASNLEEAADLNPLLEAELRGKATWTGAAGGLSDGRTVNRAMRSYHPSMKGIMGYYSPDSSEIGVKRTLSFGSAIEDTRGRLALEGTGPSAARGRGGTGPPARGRGGTGPPGEGARLLALGELMSPFTAQHADPPRQTWASFR